MNAAATSTQIKMLINSTVQCDGLRARVKREVFAAAVMPRSPERDALLSFWHERQRNVDRIFYSNGLCFNRHPTREQNSYARELAKVGNWFDSAEARHERQQLGCEA